MSLKKARQIAARAQKQGCVVQVIQHSPMVCKAHNPNRHPMEGAAVVQEITPEGKLRYLWD